MDFSGYRALLGVGALLAAGAAYPNQPPGATYTAREIVAPDGNRFEPTALNSLGQVAGALQLADGKIWHAATWDNGRVTDLGTLGGKYSAAFGINDRGQVVGYAYTPDGQERAFLWEKGNMSALSIPVDEPSAARAVNDHGQVIGTSHRSGRSRSWFWDNGKVVELGSLVGGDTGSTVAEAINSRGQVAGYSDAPGLDLQHGFLWERDLMTDLGTLGGDWSRALAVNEAGSAAGWSSLKGGDDHACLWRGGQAVDLGALGGTVGEAHGINDRGEAVGFYHGENGRRHACIWQGGSAKDLNDCVSGTGRPSLTIATAINRRGQVLALAEGRGRNAATGWLLSPALAR